MFDNILKIKSGNESHWIRNNLAEFEKFRPYPTTSFAQYNWWIEFSERMIWSFQGDLDFVIQKDIWNQESKLTGDFEKDKPINWRLEGWKYLKQQMDAQDNLNEKGGKK